MNRFDAADFSFNFGSSPFLGSLGGSGRHIVGMALAFG